MSSLACIHPLSDAEAAPMLAALGSEVRLQLFRVLLRSGREGLSVTRLHRSLGIPPSTLGHHINALVDAGLVSQERQGRELLCRAEFSKIHGLSEFLLTECCADSPTSPSPKIGTTGAARTRTGRSATT